MESLIITLIAIIILNSKKFKNLVGVPTTSIKRAFCYDCDKADCSGCEEWTPIYNEVNSAYLTVNVGDKILASCSLAFKDDFVIAQHPSHTTIDNMIGKYKMEVLTWGVENDSHKVVMS